MSLSAPSKTWNVDLLNGTITVNGVEPRLSPLERSLPVFLGLNSGSATSERIARALHAQLESGADAVKVLVYRFRRKIGHPDCVRFERGQYSLDHDPLLELRRIENEAAAAAVYAGVLDESVRRQLEGYRARLHRRRPQVLLNQAWFEWVERHLCHLERTISIRLAVDAFRRKEYAEAIDRAWDVVAMDPLDEEPWEIVLRVQLAIGKRGTALADFLRYGDLLKRELGTEPPLRFRELLSLQN